jgi:nucleotide-binding universal stress UspA family protein
MIPHYKLIIVPVDGSDSSARAAAFAADLARATDSAIQLLHVHSPTGIEIMGMAHLPRERIEEIGRERATAAFAKVHSAIDPEGLTIEEKAVWGDPRQEIVSAAEANDALIVMGRRGLGKMEQLILGSVSEGVLRTAQRPVALVT